MARLFDDHPDAIAHTAEISSRLQFELSDLGYEFPRYPVPHGQSEIGFLRERTRESARMRYQSGYKRARPQIERELDVIEKLKFAGYFLIVWDIVNFCRDEGILVQGRGSAANSAVCYALGITAVDPIAMELLFERFLSDTGRPLIQHVVEAARQARKIGRIVVATDDDRILDAVRSFGGDAVMTSPSPQRHRSRRRSR